MLEYVYEYTKLQVQKNEVTPKIVHFLGVTARKYNGF